jgi:hypothetical protein
MGTAYSEPTLIRLAYAFEQATHVRQVPRFLPTSVEPGGVLSAIQGPDVAGFGTPIALDATPVAEATPTVEPAT